MKFQSNGLSAVLVLAIGIFAAKTHATATTDVSFGILPGSSQNADAVQLVRGNDSVAAVNALAGAFAGDPWTLLDKTDARSTVFNNVTFELTADIGNKSGDWQLSWSGGGLPLNMDFVLVTKAANNWGAYLFESTSFTGSAVTGNGAFDISWFNNGGKTPGLSHASIYGRLSDAPTPTPDPIPTPVPLPSTLLLFGLGLSLLSRSRRASRLS